MPTPPDLAALRATAAASSLAGNQAAFARFVGWDKGYITRLKQRGQIALAPDGQVDFTATLDRIIHHADPARELVRQQNAAKRAPDVPHGTPPLDDRKPDAPADSDSMQYATARARKEHWLAETARVDYEQRMGTLVEQGAIVAALEDAVAVFRFGLEHWSQRIAADLAHKDIDTVRATLRTEAQALLGELSGAFAARGGAA